MNHASLRRIANAGLLSLGVAALGACSAESPAAPTGEVPSLGFIPGGTGTATTNAVAGETFKVCKLYVGADGGPVSVRVQVDAGNNGAGAGDQDFNVNVAGGACVAVWSTGGNAGSTDLVTVTETAVPGYTTTLVKATVEDGNVTTGSSVASLTANNTITNPGGTGTDGVVVTFTNTEIPDVTGCTFTQGYWKNHAGLKNQADAWPVQTLTIGGIVYTKAELVAIMQAPTKGNGIMSLVQQLIAAKLNVANGASSSAVAQAIIDADLMIDNAGGKIVPPYTSPFLDPSVTAALNTDLAKYNEGVTGPGHCDD